jgi:multidrug efflux pump subunit AcrA (membrane-fusion protein)
VPRADTPITVPITAVKFESTNGVVFTVTSEGTLQELPVTLGRVRGDSVEILGGIERDTSFVIDARGRISGEAVMITN